MSVLKHDRSESKVEFLNTLTDLEIMVLGYEITKPKKFKYQLHDFITKPIAEALIHAKIANSIYLSAQQDRDLIDEEYRTRRTNIMKSIQYVQAAITQVQVFNEAFGTNLFSNKDIELMGEKLGRELSLLKGLLKSDRVNYKKIIDSL